MKTRALIVITIGVIFVMTGCRKNDDDDKPSANYKTFLADATPRWENGATVEKNEESTNVFVTDLGGSLFSSAKYKTGRIISNGSNFEILEFSGTPAVGKTAQPSLRTASGSVDIYSLEILKIDDGKLWIVFKETESATERRIVQ